VLWIAAVAGLAGILTLYPLTTNSDENKGVAFLPTPIDVLTNDSTKEQIIEAINFVSEEYGLNRTEFYETLFGESSLNTNADNGISAGLAQFTKETWLENCSDIDDRKDLKKSLECAAKLWKSGEQWRWDVWCQKFGRNNKRCIIRGF
jgi:hypothetical protein